LLGSLGGRALQRRRWSQGAVKAVLGGEWASARLVRESRGAWKPHLDG
jgi:hypothetical protein